MPNKGFNIDTYMADPINPYQREKRAYRLQDDTLIKFSTFNPARGEEKSVGQVIHFLEADIVRHSDEFGERYSAVPLKSFSESETFEKVVDSEATIYVGIVKEVIELPGDITPDTSEEIIDLTFAGEMFPSTVLTWILKTIFELSKK